MKNNMLSSFAIADAIYGRFVLTKLKVNKNNIYWLLHKHKEYNQAFKSLLIFEWLL